MDAYALLISKIPRRKFMSATNPLPLHVLKHIRGYSKSVNDGEHQEQQHGTGFSKAPSLADEFSRVAEEKAKAARHMDQQNGTVDTEQQPNAAAGDRTSSTGGNVFAGSSEDGRNANRSE